MDELKEQDSLTNDDEEEALAKEGLEAGGDRSGVDAAGAFDLESEHGPSREAEDGDREGSGEPDLEGQIRDLTDRHLRLAAEFDNYRKRTAREWSQRVRSANAELLLDLLEIADNFDRALQVEHADGPYADGVRMIFQQLQGMLRQKGVQAIDALGRRFDPAQHEALLHIPSADCKEGDVCREIRTGYMLHERVLRPAQVAVSCGPDTPDTPDTPENEDATRES
jgi:molecular chaperone GrpE